MKLPSEFIRLPMSFDVDRLRQEVEQFSNNDWDKHPQGFNGNSALILVSARGERNNDYTGPMKMTAQLARCTYIQQVLASFNSVIGRSRLMRLDPGCQVRPHCDIDYSWRHRVRIHIPIITDEQVKFESVGNRTVHMQAGEAWIFDNWKKHAVYNEGSTRRIHLVIDTTGSAEFWQMVADNVEDPARAVTNKLTFHENVTPSLQLERYNTMPVCSPAEVDSMMLQFSRELDDISEQEKFSPQQFMHAADKFSHSWRNNWLIHGDTLAGLGQYQALLRQLKKDAQQSLGNIELPSNGVLAAGVIGNWVDALIDEKAVHNQINASTPNNTVQVAQFDRPVFIVAAPRSGSTMLFEVLSENIEFWTIGDESHSEFESIKSLHPAANQYSSNALDATHATEHVITRLVRAFLGNLKNARGTLYAEIPAETRKAQFRFLEKTPKNALRIPFLRAVFPDAKFIFLHREPRQNNGSIIDAWQSGRFVTYPKLPDWKGLPWSLLLPAGWREQQGKSVAKIAAFQWASTNQKIREDLSELPDDAWCAVSYEQLISDKPAALRALCEFADVPFGPRMQTLASEQTPLSQYTITAPESDKWKRHEEDILDALTEIQSEIGALGYTP